MQKFFLIFYFSFDFPFTTKKNIFLLTFNYNITFFACQYNFLTLSEYIIQNYRYVFYIHKYTGIIIIILIKDKQINIEYRNGIDVKSAAALSKIGDNVRFRLRAEDITKVNQLYERGCKYFFDNSMAATDWIALYYQVEIENVSEVYLADSLLYELDRVSTYCVNHGVKTRLVINRVPLTRPVKPDMWFAPFFRPQDYDVVVISLVVVSYRN